MKIAVMGNKQLKIDEKDAQSYVQRGFDIYDEKGTLEMVGSGRTVPYIKYAELEKAYKELQEQGGGSNTKAKTELKELKTTHAELVKTHEELLKEAGALRAQVEEQKEPKQA